MNGHQMFGITESGDAYHHREEWISRAIQLGDRLAGVVLITKSPHLLLPEQIPSGLLHKVIVHCTITGMGGTAIEPGVAGPSVAIQGWRRWVNEIGSERVVLRIDPIIPTEAGIETALTVVRLTGRLRSRVRVSFMDGYDHTRSRLAEVGVVLPWKPSYAPLMMRTEALRKFEEGVKLHAIASGKTWKTSIELCGENDMEGDVSGCISPRDYAALGLVAPVGVGRKGQRRTCNCLATKLDLLGHKQPCDHGCLYCYWKGTAASGNDGSPKPVGMVVPGGPAVTSADVVKATVDTVPTEESVKVKGLTHSENLGVGNVKEETLTPAPHDVLEMIRQVKCEVERGGYTLGGEDWDSVLSKDAKEVRRIFEEMVESRKRDLEEEIHESRESVKKASLTPEDMFGGVDITAPVGGGPRPTESQAEVLRQIADFLGSPETKEAELKGGAGTGKTTLVPNVVSYVQATLGKGCKLWAPTNKAANVLAEKLEKAGVSVDATTIHSGLYGPPDEQTGEFIPGTILPNTLVIVDESSMLTREVYGHIHSAVLNSRGTKVLFVGDCFQIEPVGNPSFVLHPEKSPVPAEYRFELTEVLRQALDSTILRVATKTRLMGVPIVPKFRADDFRKYRSADGIGVAYDETLRQGNILDTVMITATNHDRNRWNGVARRAIFGNSAKESFLTGEILVAVANSTAYSNSETFVVEPIRRTHMFPARVAKGTKNVLVERWIVRNGKKDLVVYLIPRLPIPSLYHSDLCAGIDNQHKKAVAEDIQVNHRTRRESISRDVVIATYGYALTAHKSQGSQWKDVYVEQSYVHPDWNPARWYYTAITRATERVNIVCREDLYQRENVGTDSVKVVPVEVEIEAADVKQNNLEGGSVMKGENIASSYNKANPGGELGQKLTNVTWDSAMEISNVPGLAVPTNKVRGGSMFSAENWYLFNTKEMGRGPTPEKMAIMETIIVAKFNEHPELVTAIDEKGGVEWLELCEHNVYGAPGVYKNAWEGRGSNSPFLRVLIAAYKAVKSNDLTEKEVAVMPRTTVVNRRVSAFDVYIGRGSKWGNPFTHRAETQAAVVCSSRDEAISMYRKWIYGEVEVVGWYRPTFEEIRKELRGKVLGCYCKPLSCHGDVLAEIADDDCVQPHTGAAPTNKAVKSNDLTRYVAIIGTAGRDKSVTLTRSHFEAMYQDAKSRVGKNDVLVSGGAAWADHIAVALFMAGLVKGLILHLPAPIDNGKFVGEFGSSGCTAQYYHDLFSKAMGVDTVSHILNVLNNMGAQGTVEPEDKPRSGYPGMAARNAKIVASATHMVAYTFGDGNEPLDGGTKRTWDMFRGPKVHVPIAKLMPKNSGGYNRPSSYIPEEKGGD